MDFDNPKVYGNTFISDGLVLLIFGSKLMCDVCCCIFAIRGSKYANMQPKSQIFSGTYNQRMQPKCQTFSGVIKEMGVIEPDDMTARLFTTESRMATGEVVKDIV